MSLEGKKAVLFGGSGGIGLAIAQHLLRAGVQKVFILDVVEVSDASLLLLKECNEQAEIMFQLCDISNRTELQKTLQEDVVNAFGSFDILVNSSGIARSEVPDKLIAVNLTGVINACLFTLDIMSRKKGGSGGVIVNVASIAGLEPVPFVPVYSASKHGLMGLTRSLGVAPVYDETGVRFVAICPGPTRTKLWDSCLQIPLELDALKQLLQFYMETLKPQSPDAVGECVVRAIVEGENGSAWICNEGKIAPHTFSSPQFL